METTETFRIKWSPNLMTDLEAIHSAFGLTEKEKLKVDFLISKALRGEGLKLSELNDLYKIRIRTEPLQPF